MLRWQPTIIAALALTLMIGCRPTVSPTPEGPVSDVTPCPTPAGQYPLHVASLYTTGGSPWEREAALRRYVIKAQEFSTLGIYTTADAQPNELPVVAVGRPVTDTTSPPPLPMEVEAIRWRLYIRGNDDQAKITCQPETDFFWQEVFAVLNPTQDCQDIFAYTLPVSRVCYMPPNTTTEQLGKHAMDDKIWLDAVLFDLGNSDFGLLRFGPGDPYQSAGPEACRHVCAPIQCNSRIGCFLHSVCRVVCPK